MITSPDNEQLKTIRKLHDKRWRDKLGLFLAEGEDLVEAAEEAGWEPEILLIAGDDVEPELLGAASTLGSGTRVVGVYRQRYDERRGSLSVYLDSVHDPGNVGAIIRSTHAFADGNVVLGPNCADPYSPKAVRATMGSIFARPPARGEPGGNIVALDPHAERSLSELAVAPPVTVCLGAERTGLPPELQAEAVRIPVATESLNVAMAATVALYELANRMPRHA